MWGWGVGGVSNTGQSTAIQLKTTWFYSVYAEQCWNNLLKYSTTDSYYNLSYYPLSSSHLT